MGHACESRFAGRRGVIGAMGGSSAELVAEVTCACSTLSVGATSGQCLQPLLVATVMAYIMRDFNNGYPIKAILST